MEQLEGVILPSTRTNLRVEPSTVVGVQGSTRLFLFTPTTARCMEDCGAYILIQMLPLRHYCVIHTKMDHCVAILLELESLFCRLHVQASHTNKNFRSFYSEPRDTCHSPELGRLNTKKEIDPMVRSSPGRPMHRHQFHYPTVF